MTHMKLSETSIGKNYTRDAFKQRFQIGIFDGLPPVILLSDEDKMADDWREVTDSEKNLIKESYGRSCCLKMTGIGNISDFVFYVAPGVSMEQILYYDLK